MTEPSVDAAETGVEAVADFGTFLRSAGKLAVARQVSALCLIGVVFVLPALTTRATSTGFVWAYFAVLTLTSVLGFGLERLAATVSATRGDTPLARALAPILSLRIATAPLAAVGMWALFAFVGVSLSPSAWWATMLWILAGLVGPVVFGGLRAAGNSSVEPFVMLVVRGAQAVVLAGLASAGAAVTPLVAAVAVLEVVGVVVAFHWIGRARDMWGGLTKWSHLPLRRALALAAMDVVALVNFRADLLLVGHMLGAVLGATYGLLYRAVDGFNGVVGSAGLWLYAESSNARDGGTNRSGIRAAITRDPAQGRPRRRARGGSRCRCRRRACTATVARGRHVAHSRGRVSVTDREHGRAPREIRPWPQPRSPRDQQRNAGNERASLHRVDLAIRLTWSRRGTRGLGALSGNAALDNGLAR